MKLVCSAHYTDCITMEYVFEMSKSPSLRR